MPETESSAVLFAEVDWDDTTSLITYGLRPDKLFLSIKAVGLLQKPLLQRKEDGLFKIICGSRRLTVCRELGLEPFSCEVLPSSVPLQTCLRITIFDNLAHRVLNPVEKSLALVKMADYMEQSELITEFMPLLDLEPSVKLCERYVKLQELEKVIHASLASDRLDERIGFALIPLEQEDRLALFKLFQELPFSVSMQEEMIETVVDIAQRDGLTPTKVIGAKEINHFREDSSRPARQRAHDVRRYLQTLRSPRLTARKQRFAEETQELGLPMGVRLVPPAYFEGPKWRLECTFERPHELAARLRRVAQLADQPAFRLVMESK